MLPKRKSLISFFLLFAIILVSIYYLKFYKQSDADQKVSVPKVLVIDRAVGDFSKKLFLFAKLHSDKSIDIIAETDGTIKFQNYEIGDYVSKGDVIIQMVDTRKVLELKEAEDLLSSYEAKMDEALSNYENSIFLREKDVISEKEKNTTLNQFKSVKYEYEAQKIRYKRVLWEFDNLNIKAPFDGFINKFYFDVGQKIVRGSNVIEFLDNSVLIGRASLSSENIRKIKDSNQIIRFTAKGMPFQARVSGISRQMNKDVSSYSLEFKIINDENNLIPGEVVEIEIEIENFENYISIPSSSIIIENNISYLFLERNNIVKRIEINPIQLNNKESLVKDSEIPDSYRVITQGQSNLQEGSRIKVDE